LKSEDTLQAVYVRSKLIIAVYVNDIIILDKTLIIIRHFKDEIRKRFQIKDLDQARDYLDIKINRNRETGTLKLSQTVYLKGLLKHYNMENCNSRETPLLKRVKLNFEDSEYLDPTNRLEY